MTTDEAARRLRELGAAGKRLEDLVHELEDALERQQRAGETSSLRARGRLLLFDMTRREPRF